MLLLDEPTAGLDIKARAGILEVVRGLVADEGIGVLWATHLVDEIRADDHVIVLHKGRVLADGASHSKVVGAAGARSIGEAFTIVIDRQRAGKEANGERSRPRSPKGRSAGRAAPDLPLWHRMAREPGVSFTSASASFPRWCARWSGCLFSPLDLRQTLGVSIMPPYDTYVLYEVYIAPGLIAMISALRQRHAILPVRWSTTAKWAACACCWSAPAPRWFLLTSKLIAGVAVSILQVYAFLVVAYFWEIEPPTWWGYLTVLPALALSGLMLGSLGMLLSSLIKQLWRISAGVMNFVIFPMFFASSALYPLWRVQEGSPWLANRLPA